MVSQTETTDPCEELTEEIQVLRNQIQQAQRLLGYALDLMIWEDAATQNAWEIEVEEFLKRK